MKIGVIGAGNIAATVSQTLAKMPEMECWAVSSRNLEKAEAFAAKYGFRKAYGSYEAMLADPEVELVYVATPHSHHREHMMLALKNGKHVLCEKAFTINAAEAEEVAEYAAEHGLYAAEAIWTRYMPSRKMIDDILASGVIGTPNTLTANLSYPISCKERIVRRELAGGALLDIGVYGLNFALMHFGTDIASIGSAVQMTDTGVDAMETITIFYNDGRMAVLTHSIYARSDRKGIIHGDKGYLVVENINNPQSVSVFDTEDNLVARYEVPEQISGYEYQFLEARRCIAEGKTQADSMPLAETIYVMDVMDDLRRQWGVVYPMEE
ncbi:MAG: Gfo/Idh/MocA family oxidoreductase [Oscillospiraceae bacterium]|nr:Gfo/Idh/MocA family oxidoreductase [Oscillospiraceae bacterium]